MNEIIELVASAMAANEGWRWADNKQMLDCAAAGLQNTSRERDSWRNRARAAIEAMRSLDEKTINALATSYVQEPRVKSYDDIREA